MGKRIFWIFILLVSAATAAAVTYLQSEYFAVWAKEKMRTKVAAELGLNLEFDRLRIGLLPPSLSLTSVNIEVKEEKNKLKLKKETVLKAERMGFSFRMIQAFSRGINVNKVFLHGAVIHLDVPDIASKEPTKLSELVHQPLLIPLGDGFSVSIRQLEVRNTSIDLKIKLEGKSARIQIGNIVYLAVTPSKAGTNSVLNLENIKLDHQSLNEEFKILRGNADISRKKIEISSFDFQRQELAAHGSGILDGNIDRAADASLNFNVLMRGPISELAAYIPELKGVEGKLGLDARITGKIDKPILKTKLEIEAFNYGLWNFEKILVNASFENSNLKLSDTKIIRNSGELAVVEPIDFPIPLRALSKSVNLKLKNLKYEDFAGEALHSVSNLKFTANGSLSLKIDLVGAEKVKLSSIEIRPDLRIDSLELNNQLYGKIRPYNQIFQTAPFNLDGKILWKQGRIDVVDSKIKLASGAISVNGSITDAKGFDLEGVTEEIDLGSEIKRISGVDIEGKGAAKLHVLGPTENVFLHFDLNQKNAKYLNFDFGDVTGRVTYDEDKDFIYLKDIKGKKNSAEYLLNGKVDIGEGDGLNLQASFSDSDPNDLFAIFKYQLREITWIPFGMGGSVKGDAVVGGGYSKGLESLAIDTNIVGSNLVYLGEFIHSAKLNANLSNSIFTAKILEARKYDTPLEGSVSYKLDGFMKYQFAARGGKIRSIDAIGSRFPLEGTFSLLSEGEGKWETLVSKTKFIAEGLFLRTREVPQVAITLDTLSNYSNGALYLGDNKDPALSLSLARSSAADSSLNVNLKNGQLDYVLCGINKKNCRDPALSFKLGLQGSGKWKGRNWERANGSLSIDEFEIAKSGFQLKQFGSSLAQIKEGFFREVPLILEGDRQKAELSLSGSLGGENLSFKASGALPSKILEFVTPLIDEGRGKLNLAFGMNGNLSNADFIGTVTLQDGFFRVSGLDAPIETLNGKFQFAGSRVRLEGFQGQMGGGTVQAVGTTNLYLDRPPKFDIELFLANNRAKFFPVTFAEVGDGKISLTGDRPPYLFGGTIKMKKVVMRSNFDMGARRGAQNARYLPEKLAGAKHFYETRIRAIADGGVFVDNSLLNAEFKGEITLLNNFEFPQIVAKGDLVRGKLLIRNNSFTLDHAHIRVPSPEYFNPQFSISGNTNVDNYKISIFATGTIDRPKITFSSYPSIPQEDIVSLLAFGYRGEDAKRLNTGDSSAITYSEVGSILLEQLQINQNLQSKGLRVVVAPSFNENEANIVRPNSDQTAAPKVYLQTQILKNLDASFGGTVGSTAGQSMDGKLEYRVGRKASVSAVYEQTPSGLESSEIKSSYGADLKFRWGFK